MEVAGCGDTVDHGMGSLSALDAGSYCGGGGGGGGWTGTHPGGHPPVRQPDPSPVPITTPPPIAHLNLTPRLPTDSDCSLPGPPGRPSPADLLTSTPEGRPPTRRGYHRPAVERPAPPDPFVRPLKRSRVDSGGGSPRRTGLTADLGRVRLSGPAPAKLSRLAGSGAAGTGAVTGRPPLRTVCFNSLAQTPPRRGLPVGRRPSSLGSPMEVSFDKVGRSTPATVRPVQDCNITKPHPHGTVNYFSFLEHSGCQSEFYLSC